MTPSDMTVNIEIDGRSMSVEPGTPIIKAADDAGIYIPRFCYHEKLSIAANCRMCLVEVEKAPKPLPACSTPVTEGMVIRTRSELAVDAQKGTMEFLLINHPLDCPICDQGGECPLQDQALGYGKDVSRYTEKKRVVSHKDIGPLVAMEMTRCIHCTRCVRFGQEVAGIMELGATGRGEHMEIGAYLDRSLDSEVSGNVIDLCPVGALTSKPYRYSARAWELQNHRGISPHDCLGSNLQIQTSRGRVMRVLPHENEAVNECWLSDRDRFSYEGVNSRDRLENPMIKTAGRWQEVDWSTALNAVSDRLGAVLTEHGPDQLGGLIAPGASLEEFYLMQKLLRSLGSGNVDHRLRETDFSGDGDSRLYPGGRLSPADFENLKTVLLVGSNIRKEQPLLAVRLRKAVNNGAKIVALNTLDYGMAFKMRSSITAAPDHMAGMLARIALAVATRKGVAGPESLLSWSAQAPADTDVDAIAQVLLESPSDAAVVLGGGATFFPNAASVRSIARWLAETVGAEFVELGEANSVAGWLAGCVPGRGLRGERLTDNGFNVQQMITQPRRAYLIHGLEPLLDAADGSALCDALNASDVTVAISSYRSAIEDCADIALPLASFCEQSGTYVNFSGLVQKSRAAATPAGEARPGWKIIRVLGNHLGVSGFEQNSIEQLADEIGLTGQVELPQTAQGDIALPTNTGPAEGFRRVTDVPPYRTDAVVRRAASLGSTADNPPVAAGLNAEDAEKIGVTAGELVEIASGESVVRLPVSIDARVPRGSCYLPTGFVQTAATGINAALTVSPVREQAVSGV